MRSNALLALTVVLVGVSGVARADPPVPIRFASGYPSTGETDGNSRLTNYIELGLGGYWGVTGVYVTIGDPTVIAKVAAIGATLGPPTDDFGPQAVSVHSDEGAFAADPMNGDVHKTPRNAWLIGEPTPLGTVSADGRPLYYVEFGFDPFRVDPGVYIFSLPIARVEYNWSWAETDIDLGSDIFTNYQNVGTYFVWETAPGKVTGTAAFDVYGHQPCLVFRQKDGDPGSFWRPLEGEAPGWDHVGLLYERGVYESHPGSDGEFFDPYWTQEKYETIRLDNGVQVQHTIGSFEHYSTTPTSTALTEEVVIPADLAEAMVSHIETRMDARFRELGSTLDDYLVNMQPHLQKGAVDDEFTCVGLLEWAAEETGLNEGQGLIPDAMESVTIPGEPDLEVPMLTPDLLAACVGAESHQGAIEEWLVGFFDPVDFIVTDPVGRRLGYTDTLGLLEEIPDAFYTGDGLIEQFMIPNPLPGQYTIELFGLGEDTLAALGTSLAETGF